MAKSATEALIIQRDILMREGYDGYRKLNEEFLEKHKEAHSIVVHEPTKVAIKAIYLNPVWNEMCDRAMFWTLVVDEQQRNHPLAFDQEY